MDNGLRRVLRKDPELPHQAVMLARRGGHLLVLSCNCLRTRGDGWSPADSWYDAIEERTLWLPGEAIAAWREHLAEAEGATA